MVMGIQYPLTPLLITECQWQIAGIAIPVIIFTLLRREVVNLRFSSGQHHELINSKRRVVRVRCLIVDDSCSVDV